MKRTIKISINVALLFCLNNFLLASAESIKIVSSEWQGYSHKDGSGYYLELMKEIYNDAGVVDVKLVPYARSLDMVKGTSINCLRPLRALKRADTRRYPQERLVAFSRIATS